MQVQDRVAVEADLGRVFFADDLANGKKATVEVKSGYGLSVRLTFVDCVDVAIPEDEVALANNRAAFDRIRFKPRTLVDVSKRSLKTTVLGEELLFRGYLLPRMNGAFGRGDWVANGLLFAGYHLHTPWVIPTTLLDTFILSYPSKRYRSALIGIAVHSAQSILVLGLVFALVLKG